MGKMSCVSSLGVCRVWGAVLFDRMSFLLEFSSLGNCLVFLSPPGFYRTKKIAAVYNTSDFYESYDAEKRIRPRGLNGRINMNIKSLAKYMILLGVGAAADYNTLLAICCYACSACLFYFIKRANCSN